MGRRTQCHFHAAAADVDHARRRRPHVDPVAGRQVNQPRFFGAGNDLDTDTGPPIHLGDEIAAVFGLTGGTRGGGDDLVHLMRVRQLLEFRERLAGPPPWRSGSGAYRQARRTQPDHVFFSVDDLKRQVGAHLHNDHVDGIGPDVDGGYAHAVGVSAQRCASCLRETAEIYSLTDQSSRTGNENPIMTTRRTLGQHHFLKTRARALRRYLPAAVAGDDKGVHRLGSHPAASARPSRCSPQGAFKGSKSKKAGRKIRRLTRALGTVRELDVTLNLIDELSGSDDLSRPALQDVRLHVVGERDNFRETMLEGTGGRQRRETRTAA